MLPVAVIDESFDPNITSTYHLLVVTSPDSFSFCILDTVRMKFLALKSFHFDSLLAPERQVDELQRIFHTEGFLIRNYKAVFVSFNTGKSLLVPSPLFNPDRLETYFRYGTPVDADEEILFTRIPAIDAHVLYAVPRRVMAEIENSLDQVRFFNQACPLITDAITDRTPSPSTRAYLLLNGGFFDLAAFMGNKLLLYNSYPSKSVEDQVFLVLYAYEQLDMDPENTTLWLSGQVEDQDPLVWQLRKYIRRVEFMEFNRSFSYSYTFNDLSQHRFVQLINLARCES